MAGEGEAHRVRVLFPEASAPLNVREEEGDRSSRRNHSHLPSLPARRRWPLLYGHPFACCAGCCKRFLAQGGADGGHIPLIDVTRQGVPAADAMLLSRLSAIARSRAARSNNPWAAAALAELSRCHATRACPPTLLEEDQSIPIEARWPHHGKP